MSKSVFHFPVNKTAALVMRPGEPPPSREPPAGLRVWTECPPLIPWHEMAVEDQRFSAARSVAVRIVGVSQHRPRRFVGLCVCGLYQTFKRRTLENGGLPSVCGTCVKEGRSPEKKERREGLGIHKGMRIRDATVVRMTEEFVFLRCQCGDNGLIRSKPEKVAKWIRSREDLQPLQCDSCSGNEARVAMAQKDERIALLESEIRSLKAQLSP